MPAQDILTWIDLPESGAERAWRFYEVLLDIAASRDLHPPPQADACCRCGSGAARTRAAAPPRGQEA